MQLNSKFKDTDIINYVGISKVNIVFKDGKPVINPTRKELSTYIKSIDAEGDEFEYIKEVTISKGYSALGGKEIISKKEYEERGGEMSDDGTLLVEPAVKKAMVHILCSADLEKEVSVKGVKEKQTSKFYFLMRFSFIDAPWVSTKNEGEENWTRLVYNKFGSTAWLDGNNNKNSVNSGIVEIKNSQDKMFMIATDEDVYECPKTAGSLGFRELIDFILAFGKIGRNEFNICDKETGINPANLFKGDFKAVSQAIAMIKKARVENKIDLTGVNVLLVGNLNNGKVYQDYYNVFEAAILNKTGKLNKASQRIKGSILKERGGNPKYTPESKGMIVSNTFGGLPHFGLKELTENSINTFMIRTNSCVEETATTDAFDADDEGDLGAF